MSKDVLEEARIVDLDDEALKEFLGYTFESVKSLEEKKRTDPDIAQMRQKLKSYIEDAYNDSIKSMKARLKAARSVAHARGIKWRPPTKDGA
jgi:UDP-N-acetylmuramyl pentapeptide synthase